MKSINPTPMPHFGVLDDGLLPLVVKQIFMHASSAKELNSLLNIIKDRSYFLADKKEQDRILTLMDAVNLKHSAIAEVTFKNIGEADQDSLMHFGFEQFAYMSILDCCVLTALCLIDQTDVLLYRDYSQYKEGYVQHFISTAPSDNKAHLLVLNISKLVCSFLVNHEGKIQIAQAEKFAQKLFDLMLALRKDGFLAPVFLKQTDSSYANLLVKLCLKRNEGAASSQLNFLQAQLKAFLKVQNYEFAAQIRFKIKNIESNSID
jgi:hypothetical protein